MGILERLFGGGDEAERRGHPRVATPDSVSGRSADDQAIERYRYLVRTAPPETIEQAHAEAFAHLTPEQRRMVLDELSQGLPPHERVEDARNADDPRALARMATRAELRQPGTLERTFGGMTGPGIGFGGLMAGSFLSSFAGMLVAGAIADQFFQDDSADQGAADGPESGEVADAQDTGGDYTENFGDAGTGFGGDFGGDFGGGDFGGDF